MIWRGYGPCDATRRRGVDWCCRCNVNECRVLNLLRGVENADANAHANRMQMWARHTCCIKDNLKRKGRGGRRVGEKRDLEVRSLL
jgi:hypothetical protein